MGKPTLVQLVGGLGNQLGGYWFGRYLASFLGHEIVFDTSEIDRGLTKHGVTLQSLDLPGRFLNVRAENTKGEYLARRLSYAIQARLPFPIHALTPFPSYTARDNGWSSLHEKQNEGLTMRGDFLSTFYFKSLYPSAPPSVRLNAPSNFFLESRQELSRARHVFIHVRRGDYTLLSNSLGLVGLPYYENALKGLKALGLEWDCIVVYSDDIEAAKSLLKPMTNREKLIFVQPPPGTNPAETMLLMGLASGSVIPNSTFSLWGALLSQNSGPVVAPRPWFKGISEPTRLFTTPVIRVDATFE